MTKQRLLAFLAILFPSVVCAANWWKPPGGAQMYGFTSPIAIPKTTTITSPKIILSPFTSHAVIYYTVKQKPKMLIASYQLQCNHFKISGWKLVWKWETIQTSQLQMKTDVLNLKRPVCAHLFEVVKRKCVTQQFRVQIKIVTSGGNVGVDLPKFKDSCEKDTKTTANCVFQDTDCGFRNDACGIVQWKIGVPVENKRKRRSLGFNSGKTVQLLKDQTSTTCHYGINVTVLQPSGYTVSEDKDRKKRNFAQGPERKPRSITDYGLYLDPSDVSPLVAIAIFNTPTLIHHVSNRILKFDYYFFSGGLHQIIVSLICMSDAANSYMRLRKNEEYSVDNFILRAYTTSGRKCLDLHSSMYSWCTAFKVQFIGGAIGSVLLVDNVHFYERQSAICSGIDNV